MRHLIVSREFPPAPYPPGGIGTYVAAIARLLAEAGDEVHVVAQQWDGAPEPAVRLVDGRLVVHRVPVDAAVPGLEGVAEADGSIARALARQSVAQAFAWQAALLVETLVERHAIDVIEAQEWEAPLHYFQLRRALGLGPHRTPPCLVHLHSPTELIWRGNDWSPTRPGYVEQVRFEDYTIGAADGWLCPSRFLARQAETHYGLPPHAVATIPLPLGDTRPLARDAATWARGSVCFVGRLEPRKGVIEWVDAAVGVAARHPELVFDLVGADLPLLEHLSVQEWLEARIPPALRPRFRFHGSQPRSALPTLLAGARIAVVPSRWENFPNTCVEAMASGLPVLVSPDGGMPEMVEDGVAGWVAASSAPASLATALERALAVPPTQLAAMGEAARAAVHTLCDNGAIVARHRALRAELATRGACRSLSLPAAYPWSRRERTPRAPAPVAGGDPLAEAGRHGTAVVLTAADLPPRDAGDAGDTGDAGAAALAARLSEAIASVEALDPPARTRVLVCGASAAARPGVGVVVRGARAGGWTVVEPAVGDGGPAAALDGPLLPETLAAGDGPLGVLLLASHHRVAPDALAHAEAVLRLHPGVGVVGGWVELGPTLQAPPCPTLPHQLLADDTGPAPIFRAEALAAVGGVRAVLPAAWQAWDAANAVLAAGWQGVTYPARLACADVVPGADGVRAHVGRPRARRLMLERVRCALAEGALELLLHLDPPPGPREVAQVTGTAPDAATSARPPGTMLHPSELPPGQRLAWALQVVGGLVKAGLTRPARAVRWLGPRLGRAMARRERGNGA